MVSLIDYNSWEPKFHIIVVVNHKVSAKKTIINNYQPSHSNTSPWTFVYSNIGCKYLTTNSASALTAGGDTIWHPVTFPWLNPLEIKNNGTTRIVEQIVKSFLLWLRGSQWFWVMFCFCGMDRWDLSFILHCCWWWGGRPQEQQILWWSFEEPNDKSAPNFLLIRLLFEDKHVFFCWWINILRSKKGVQIMCQFSTKFSQYIKVTNKLNYQGRLPPQKIITYTLGFHDTIRYNLCPRSTRMVFYKILHCSKNYDPSPPVPCHHLRRTASQETYLGGKSKSALPDLFSFTSI